MINSKSLFFFFSAVLLVAWGCSQKIKQPEADAITQARIERIEKTLYPIYNLRGLEKPKTIQQMMQESNIVGLSIAFADNGKIAWTKCYGYTNLKDSAEITPNTIFRAASLSKPLTAMAALHFVEEGKLELNEDINQKLVGWKLPGNEYTKDKKVTAAQLIGHTSGIKNAVRGGIPPEEKLPALEDIFSGKTQYPPAEVISVPGEKYKYSNMGYMVLSELLADVAGKDYPELMDEVILKPCKMKSSTFNQELPASFKNRIATGYDENGQEVSFYKHASYGAGALWTTPRDLGKFLAEILSTCHNKDKAGKMISHEMAKKVFEEKREKLGFNKYFENGNFVFRNDGSIPGYNCILMGSLAKNQAVVLMLNTGSDKAYDFLNYLWRAVSMEYGWGLFEPEFYTAVDIPADEITKYEGIYSSQKDTISIIINNNQLEVNSTETGKQQLVAVGNTTFLIPDIPMRFYFETDTFGTATNLYTRDAGGNGRGPYGKISNTTNK